MATYPKDNLFILIKSLSKSEKRQFKVYTNRLGVNVDAKFLFLFNLLDKMNHYDENEILKSKIVTKQQLSNLKAHLYKQILISLRLNPQNQNIRIQLREQLDFATILYQKGLYKQSLKILDKTKNLALENEEKNVAFEIIELEKVIESQYITRSISGRADELTIQAKEISQLNVVASKLSNLSLQLYGYLLKVGYAKSDYEMQEITKYFNDRLPKTNGIALGFRELLWLNKAYLWYNFLIQNFLACYKYSKKWVDLFYDNPNMINLNPVWYIKGTSYLLECLYLLKYQTLFKETLDKFEALTSHSNFPKTENINVLHFICYSNSKFNYCFLTGNYAEEKDLTNKTLQGIELHKNHLDEHHIMVLYYKIACYHFGLENYKECIFYLNKIIDNKNLTMREDLMCFSRLLNLIAHYEYGDDFEIDSQIKSTFSFLIKMNDLHEVQKEIIKFLKRIQTIYPSEIKKEFKVLYSKLLIYENHPYEKRAFLYLDILSWLESKIENKPVLEIIRSKANKQIR